MRVKTYSSQLYMRAVLQRATTRLCAICTLPWFCAPPLVTAHHVVSARLPVGLTLHLDNLRIYNPTALATGSDFTGNVLVAPTATVGKGCLIGPDVSIGEDCVIGDGVRLSNCVVMRRVRIKDHCKVGAGSTSSTQCALRQHFAECFRCMC